MTILLLLLREPIIIHLSTESSSFGDSNLFQKGFYVGLTYEYEYVLHPILL